MPNVLCQSCKNIIHTSSSILREIGTIICIYCHNDKKGSDIVKAAYNLMERTQHESIVQRKDAIIARQERQREESIYTIQGMSNPKNTLPKYLTPKLATIMQTFSTYTDEMEKQVSNLSEAVNRSIKRILAKTEKGIIFVIGQEAKHLSEIVRAESKDNQKIIEKYKTRSQKIREELKAETINKEFYQGLDEEQTKQKMIPIFEKEVINTVISVLDKQVQKMENKHPIFTTFIQRGEMIQNELIHSNIEKVEISRVTEASSRIEE